MNPLPCFLFVLSALALRAATPAAPDFIFPLLPQSEREIKMNGKPSIRGKLLLYAPARVHIERPNGSILLVQPSDLTDAELRNFPDAAVFGLSELANQAKVEDAMQKLRRIIEDLEAENQLNLRALERLQKENLALKETHTQFNRSMEQSSAATAAKVTSKSVAIKWRELAKYSGTGPQVTAPFTITGRQWRVRWLCTAQQSSGGFLSVSSRGADDFLLVNTIQPGSDTSYGRNRGRFNLDIRSSGMSWTLTVEEATP